MCIISVNGFNEINHTLIQCGLLTMTFQTTIEHYVTVNVCKGKLSHKIYNLKVSHLCIIVIY